MNKCIIIVCVKGHEGNYRVLLHSGGSGMKDACIQEDFLEEANPNVR